MITAGIYLIFWGFQHFSVLFGYFSAIFAADDFYGHEFIFSAADDDTRNNLDDDFFCKKDAPATRAFIIVAIP
jgi:hypothetical protein